MRPETLRARDRRQRRRPAGARPGVAPGRPWAGRWMPTCRARKVLLRTSDQLFAALGLIELDGVAARIVIAPPDVKPEHLPVRDRARRPSTVVVGDDPALAVDGVRFEPLHLPQAGRRHRAVAKDRMGAVHLRHHRRAQDGGAYAGRPDRRDRSPATQKDIVWGTFYDIRRYGGLQILLRALLGQASLILSDARRRRWRFPGAAGPPRRHPSDRHAVALAPRPDEPGQCRDRAALCAPVGRDRRPGHSGQSEGALSRTPPMGHAYASTEAGVGFEVTDGLEGFPASFLGRAGPVEMKIVDGTLHIRSPRTASALCRRRPTLVKIGWVDTGDMIEQRGDRCYFVGRARRHHQCRRPEDKPRGSGGGDQPPSRRARCRAYRAAKAPSPAPSSSPMWC